MSQNSDTREQGTEEPDKWFINSEREWCKGKNSWSGTRNPTEPAYLLDQIFIHNLVECSYGKLNPVYV